MRSKIVFLILFIIVIAVNSLFAQQDPQFSQYMFNKPSYNPGALGMKRAMCFTSLYREQWSGFPGNPKNVLVAADLFVPPAGGGMGLTFIKDELGFDKTSIAKLGYSFHIRRMGPGTLGLGIELGLMQKSLNGPWVYVDPNDRSIPMNGASDKIFDAGIGAYYEIENKLFIGISSLHLPQSTYVVSGVPFYKMKSNYYLTAGYTMYVPDMGLEIMPSILAKSDAVSTQVDINLIGLWRDRIWTGTSYRLTDAIVLLGGVKQDLMGGILKVGYSYDVTTSKLNNYSTGSHEWMLSFCRPVSWKERKTVWSNPRHMW